MALITADTGFENLFKELYPEEWLAFLELMEYRRRPLDRGEEMARIERNIAWHKDQIEALEMIKRWEKE